MAQGKPARSTVGQWMALLVVLFFVLPLAVTNLWGYVQTRHYLTEAALQHGATVADLLAAEVLGAIEHTRAELLSATLGDHRLHELARALEGGTDAEPALEAHLRARATEDPAVIELQVISRDGSVALSSRRTDRAPDLTSALCFQIGRAAPSIAALADEPGQGPVLLVALPLLERQALVGVLCARLHLPVEAALARAQEGRAPGTQVSLIDGAGVVLSSSPPSPSPPSLPSAARAAWSGLVDRDGVAQVVAVAPVGDLAWRIVVEAPVAAALASLEELKVQALLASSAVVAILIVALYLGWRMIVMPLRELSRTSDRLAAGERHVSVPPGGPREVAELAAGFNHMSAVLHEAHEDLERRIEARTVELRRSQDFLELLLNSIDQRVVLVDRSYRILKANQAAVRMHRAELTGSLCYEEFEGRTSPCEHCPVRATFATGEHASAERSQHTARGPEALRIETYPVPGPSGDVGSVISIARVVTEEKQLQAKMAYQEKMAAFGQLAAGMAHEIGNPLAAVDSQLRLAQEQPGRAEQSLGVVRREVGRMSRLLRELVDFARRKRDDVRLVSVNQVVEDITRMLEHDPRARSVELSRDLAEDLPGVRVIEDNLAQVLLNLGINALDAAREAGAVTFSTRLEGGQVVVRVRDDGPGVPASVQAHLFEPFFTTKEPGRGTGLGLFVSRGIVQDLGGRLLLERTGSDGTVFALWLPRDVSP